MELLVPAGRALRDTTTTRPPKSANNLLTEGARATDTFSKTKGFAIISAGYVTTIKVLISTLTLLMNIELFLFSRKCLKLQEV